MLEPAPSTTFDLEKFLEDRQKEEQQRSGSEESSRETQGNDIDSPGCILGYS